MGSTGLATELKTKILELENKILNNVFQFEDEECSHEKLEKGGIQYRQTQMQKVSDGNLASRAESEARIKMQADFVSNGMTQKCGKFFCSSRHYRIEKGVLYYWTPKADEKSFSLPDTVTDTRNGEVWHNVAIDDDVVQIRSDDLDEISLFKPNDDGGYPLLRDLQKYYGVNDFPVATLTADRKDRTVFSQRELESLRREIRAKTPDSDVTVSD